MSAAMSASQEGAQVSAVYEGLVKSGQTWHVIDAAWFDSWKIYTGFDTLLESVLNTPTGGRPGPIDNSKLVDPEYRDEAAILSKTLLEGTDYVLLEERTALLLESWYGGPGPVIARKVISVGAVTHRKLKVELFPVFLRLVPCGADGKADMSTSTVVCFSEKNSFSDVQESLHQALLAKEAAEPSDGPPGGIPMSDATPEPSATAGGVDADMEEGFMAETKTLPKVTEAGDEDKEQVARVRLWIRKPKQEGAASSSSSDSDSSSMALVPVSGVIDHAMPGLLGGASSSMDVDEAKDGVSSSAVPSAPPSVPAAPQPDDGFGDVDGTDYKCNYSVRAPAESLDPEDKLDPSDPNTRTTPLPQKEELKDDWYLLIDEELSEPLEAFQLPQMTAVLVESSTYATREDADGMLDIYLSWPRAAYSHTKQWTDFDVGDVIDVKDTQDCWCLAKIRAVNQERQAIFVAYKKYSDKWNAWVSTDPAKGRVGEANSHTATAVNVTSSSNNKSSSSSSSSSYSSHYGSSSYSYFSSHEDGTPEALGAVGLKNLGNTCFMNSTLQCLSHSVPLTAYFLSDSYRDHLNRDNPLGWKGRVAEEYGKLLKELWCGKYLSVAPRDLKTEISTVQPRFEGYAQHDSSELLSFLLDGLHEDLNRVLKKPATSSIDSNNRPDSVVAAESWQTYKMRNESIIVDLMQGQLKSTVVCPEANCGRVSITFDPVQFLSVPLPVASDTIVKVKLVYADGTRPIVEVAAVVPKSARLTELKAAVCAAVGDIANPRRLILGDMFSHRIYKYFDEDGVVSDIKSNDLVYAFECPEVEEYVASAGGFYPITVIYQRQELNPYYNPKYPHGHEKYRTSNFGLPRVVCLPKKGNATVRQILAAIRRHTAPKLKSSDPAAAADTPLTEAEIDSAYTVLISDEKGTDGSCGHHDTSGYNSDRCSGCVLQEYSLIKQRDAAAVEEAKKKAAAQTAAYRASLAKGPLTSKPIWPTGDDSDEDVESPAAAAVEEDATMVEAPTNASPEGTAGDFVNVEMTEGVAGEPAAASTATTGPDLDVEFVPRLAKSYLYGDNDVTPRCAFVVRVPHTEKPVAPAPVPGVLVKSPVDDVMPLDADSPVASPSPDLDTTSPSVEGETETAGATAAAAIPSPWYDPAAAEHEVKHASVDAAATENADSISILDCVKAFSKEETLSVDEQWYCRDCKEHRQATKKFDLWKLPNILIIHLKRFSYSRYSRDKISTPVHFPLVGLSLADCTANPEHANDLYDLYAVSNHMGGLGGGHYNAYARNHTNGVWYLHDDSSVSRVRHLNDIRSSSAYVLFFAKRAPGVAVKTEAEVQADIDAYEATKPKAAYSGYSSSYGSSRLSELD